MSAEASLAVRHAIRGALLADATLIARLGGSRIFDEVPEKIGHPYVVFGDERVRDWSTSSDTGSAHTLNVEIWSRHRGLHECLEIAALVEAVLEQALPVPGFNLVQLRVETIETSRRDRGRLALARLRVLAVVDRP
jgi:hypothetical protein